MKNIILRVFLLLAITAVLSSESTAKEFIVVIDAGHGGKDAGSVDNEVKEKDINLGVALKLGDMIKKKLKGVKVVLTRDDDTYLTLQQRADKANSVKGDLFISIHSNSVDLKNPNRKNVRGTSTHVLGLHKDANNMAVARRENSVIKLESDYQQKYSGFDPSSDESYIIFEMAQKKNLSRSIAFANSVQKQMKSVAGRKDNGVHQNGFWVLWATSMPAVLVELDFICNPESAQYISSKEGQTQMATALFNAVKEYYVDSKKPVVADAEVITPPKEEDSAGSTPIAAVKDSQKTEAPKIASNTTVSSKRKRRSEASKIKSCARNLETSELIIHKETETASAVSTKQPKESEPKIKASSGKRKTQVSVAKQKQPKKKERDRRSHLNNENRRYQVLLLTSEEHLNPEDPCFSKFPPVTCVSSAGKYSYFCGRFDNISDARNFLDKARKKFADAVIVTSAKPFDKNN